MADEHAPGAQQSQAKDNLIPNVKHVIAVSSGKGGVGKSTIASNLACALALTGAKVGLLDADLYGPNIPMMMGSTTGPEQKDGKIVPVENYGVKLISMAYLVPEDAPLVWRGPMVHQYLQAFFRDVLWGELDYLLIDLPPGTGGAIDMMRAATLSRGGRSIIALKATAAGDSSSRIVAALPRITAATILRTDVDYVVTEYGARRIRHLALTERANALAEIAAPQFQDELRKGWASLAR